MATTYSSANRRCRDRLSRRVLRGGSFNNNQNNVRCAARNRNNPHNRNNNVGFRYVAHGFLSYGSALFRITRYQHTVAVVVRQDEFCPDSYPLFKGISATERANSSWPSNTTSTARFESRCSRFLAVSMREPSTSQMIAPLSKRWRRVGGEAKNRPGK